MKYTFISSVNYAYMLSLNATINANAYYGTNADFHILYDSSLSDEYRARTKDAFPFKIEWVPRGDFGNDFNRVKYNFARSLKGVYDAVCLIDADLFVCCNTLEQFQSVSDKRYLISAGWPQGTFAPNDPDTVYLPFGEPEKITCHFGQCFYADFPLFVNPKLCSDFLDYWYNNTANFNDMLQHSIVALNRGVCSLFKQEELGVLNGYLWVADSMFWNETFEIREVDEKRILYNVERNHQMMAIHNKWWRHGCANAEFRSLAQGLLHHGFALDVVAGFKKAEDNFNAIYNHILFFNDLTPDSRIEPYFPGRIEAKPHLIEQGLWRDWY